MSSGSIACLVGAFWFGTDIVFFPLKKKIPMVLSSRDYGNWIAKMKDYNTKRKHYNNQ
jgi:hypothetical protein